MRARHFSTAFSIRHWTVLGLCSASLVIGTLWIRSCYVADQVELSSCLAGRSGIVVFSDDGQVSLMLAPFLNERMIVHRSHLPSSLGGGLGASMPYWLLVTICAGAAAALQYQAFRRRAAGSAVCATCGYDLRASRERCPECGTVIPADRQETRL